MEVNTIRTTGITVGGHEEAADKNTVSFMVKYPKDYKGLMAMPDGSIQEVAPDAAEHFESLGIGHIATAAELKKAATAQEEPEVAGESKTITTDSVTTDETAGKSEAATASKATGKKA